MKPLFSTDYKKLAEGLHSSAPIAPLPQPLPNPATIQPAPEVPVMSKRTATTHDVGLAELEAFFASVEIPDEPIQLAPHMRITDPRKFVESHLAALKHNAGNPTFALLLQRLQQLRSYMNGF